jgi:hypothetical protein
MVESGKYILIFGRKILLHPVRRLMNREDFSKFSGIGMESLANIEPADTVNVLRATAGKLREAFKLTEAEFIEQFVAEPGMSCLIVRADAANTFKNFVATYIANEKTEMDESEVLRRLVLRGGPCAKKEQTDRLAREAKAESTSKSRQIAEGENPPKPLQQPTTLSGVRRKKNNGNGPNEKK